MTEPGTHPRDPHADGPTPGGFLASLLDTATGSAVHARVPGETAAPHVHLSVQYVRAAVPDTRSAPMRS